MKWFKVWLMIVTLVCVSTAQDKKADKKHGNLKATVTAHSVVLSWVNSTSACVQNTNLHRVQVPGSEAIGTNFAVVPVPTQTYTDNTVVSGQTYYWTVSAYGSGCGGTGNESVMGNEVTTVIPVDCVLPSTLVNGVCTAPPLPPTGLTGVPK